MTRQLAFLALLIFSTLFACLRGGRPEKIGAVTLFAGAWISAWAVRPHGLRFRHVETGILLIDLTILGVFLWLSLRSTRFWPIWLAALLNAEILVHLGLIVAPQVNWRTYMDTTALWGWAAQAMLILATWRHQIRLAQHGADAPWKARAI